MTTATTDTASVLMDLHVRHERRYATHVATCPRCRAGEACSRGHELYRQAQSAELAARRAGAAL